MPQSTLLIVNLNLKFDEKDADVSTELDISCNKHRRNSVIGYPPRRKYQDYYPHVLLNLYVKWRS